MWSQNPSNLEWQLKCILRSVPIISEMTVNGYRRACGIMHCNCSRKMLSGRHCCVVSSSQLLLAILNNPIMRTKTISAGRQGSQTTVMTVIYCRSCENGTVIIVQSGSGSHLSLRDWCMFVPLNGRHRVPVQKKKKKAQRTTSSPQPSNRPGRRRRFVIFTLFYRQLLLFLRHVTQHDPLSSVSERALEGPESLHSSSIQRTVFKRPHALQSLMECRKLVFYLEPHCGSFLI